MLVCKPLDLAHIDDAISNAAIMWSCNQDLFVAQLSLMLPNYNVAFPDLNCIAHEPKLGRFDFNLFIAKLRLIDLDPGIHFIYFDVTIYAVICSSWDVNSTSLIEIVKQTIRANACGSFRPQRVSHLNRNAHFLSSSAFSITLMTLLTVIILVHSNARSVPSCLGHHIQLAGSNL